MHLKPSKFSHQNGIQLDEQLYNLEMRTHLLLYYIYKHAYNSIFHVSLIYIIS